MRNIKNNVDEDEDETSRLLSGVATSKSTSTADNLYDKRQVSLCSRLFCCRNVLALLQFCGFVTVYGMRANLSVALVAMVNQTYAEQSSGNHIIEPECRKHYRNGSRNDEPRNEVCIYITLSFLPVCCGIHSYSWYIGKDIGTVCIYSLTLRAEEVCFAILQDKLP